MTSWPNLRTYLADGFSPERQSILARLAAYPDVLAVRTLAGTDLGSAGPGLTRTLERIDAGADAPEAVLAVLRAFERVCDPSADMGEADAEVVQLYRSGEYTVWIEWLDAP